MLWFIFNHNIEHSIVFIENCDIIVNRKRRQNMAINTDEMKDVFLSGDKKTMLFMLDYIKTIWEYLRPITGITLDIM